MKKLLFRLWALVVLTGLLLMFIVPLFKALVRIPWRYIRYEYTDYLEACKVVLKGVWSGEKQ